MACTFAATGGASAAEPRDGDGTFAIRT